MRATAPILVSAVVLVLVPLASMVSATPPEPTYGTAVVDGLYDEWLLEADFFADLYRAGSPDHGHESTVYTRYDCNTYTAFVLVLHDDGHVGMYSDSAVTNWVAVDANSNKVVNELAGANGVSPDFAWVGRGFDGDPYHVLGYEASFCIEPGNYIVIVHSEVVDSSGDQTSATIGFPSTGPDLVISCQSPVSEGSWGRLKLLYR